MIDAELIHQINTTRGTLPDSIGILGRFIFNKSLIIPYHFFEVAELLYRTFFLIGVVAIIVLLIKYNTSKQAMVKERFKSTKKYLTILALIILIGFGLRFYMLEKYPVHLGHDEVTQLYDAISIKETGKDIYGNNYPFIFKSVNDNKPPFYTYITIPSFMIFGWRELAIRFPGAMCGTLLIPVIFYFVYKFTHNYRYGLAASLFTAIAPFEVIYSRKSFENQAGILLTLLGISLVKTYIDNPKKRLTFYIGTATIALAAYTYFSHAILIPFLYVAFLFLYKNEIGKEFKKGLVLLLLLLAPLYYLISITPQATQRSRDVSLIKDPKVANDLANVSGTSFEAIKVPFIYISHAYSRVLNNLSPTFLFVNGMDLTNYDFIDVGPLYAFQLPLMLLGGLYLIRKGGKFSALLILIGTLSFLPAILTFENYSPHRIIAVFSMLNIVSAVGLVRLIKILNQFSLVKRSIMLGALGVLAVYSMFYVALIYTFQNPTEKSHFLHYPFKQVAQSAWENYGEYDRIIFDPSFGLEQPFIGTGSQYYLAFYGHLPPQVLQTEYRMGDETKRETLFGKFSVKALFWPDDRKVRNALVIASPWSISRDSFDDSQLIKEIKYYNSNITAFYVVGTDE